MQGLNSLENDFILNLMFNGAVSVPTFLLRHYRDLDINDREMIVLIHILGVLQQERDCYPTAERLAQLMTAGVSEVKALLASLMEKNILGVEKVTNPETGYLVNSYSFQGLVKKLAGVWETEQARLAAEMKKAAEMGGNYGKIGAGELPGLARTFEREFGRPLSPMEHDEIIKWFEADRFPDEIILAALKRAVLRGVLNFKYIDRILREWDKKSLRTLREIEIDEEHFQEKHVQKKGQRGDKEAKPPVNKSDKFRDLYVNLK